MGAAVPCSCSARRPLSWTGTPPALAAPLLARQRGAHLQELLPGQRVCQPGQVVCVPRPLLQQPVGLVWCGQGRWLLVVVPHNAAHCSRADGLQARKSPPHCGAARTAACRRRRAYGAAGQAPSAWRLWTAAAAPALALAPLLRGSPSAGVAAARGAFGAAAAAAGAAASPRVAHGPWGRPQREDAGAAAVLHRPPAAVCQLTRPVQGWIRPRLREENNAARCELD